MKPLYYKGHIVLSGDNVSEIKLDDFETLTEEFRSILNEFNKSDMIGSFTDNFKTEPMIYKYGKEFKDDKVIIPFTFYTSSGIKEKPVPIETVLDYLESKIDMSKFGCVKLYYKYDTIVINDTTITSEQDGGLQFIDDSDLEFIKVLIRLYK